MNHWYINKAVHNTVAHSKSTTLCYSYIEIYPYSESFDQYFSHYQYL